jgi:hypothetical protein
VQIRPLTYIPRAVICPSVGSMAATDSFDGCGGILRKDRQHAAAGLSF